MEHTVDYRGGKLFYSVSGRGDTIVLIHGYLESSEIWGEFGQRLADNYRVIAVDLPGNGRSSLYTDEHTMCFLADGVMAILDKEGADRATILGHSLGGYVTLSIVDRFPDRLNGYILFHSHPFADSGEVKEYRIREIDIILSGKKDLVARVNIPGMYADSNLEKFSDSLELSKRIALEHEAEGIVSILFGMMNRKARDHVVAEGKVPSLVILGTMDNYIDCESMRERLSLPSNSSIVILDKSGHMGFIEECDRSVEIVSGFMKSVSKK